MTSYDESKIKFYRLKVKWDRDVVREKHVIVNRLKRLHKCARKSDLINVQK